jgi:predicted PurR-regulated permease PerM
MPNQRISQPNSTSSPPWSRTTKAIAGVFAILLIILVIWRFQELLTPLIIALILAYLLQPVINLAIRYTGWKRGWVVLLVYVTALIIWTVLAIALGVIAFEQISRLLTILPTLVQQTFTSGIDLINEITDQTYEIGRFTFYIPGPGEIVNLTALEGQVVGWTQQAIGRGGSVVLDLAQGVFSSVAMGLLMFVVSIYIARDLPRLGSLFANMARFPGYQDDANRLASATANIWNTYLRGQILLALIIGSIVTIFMWLMGVRYALALGVLAGLMEFLPIIGPTISTIVAMMVALVFGSSHFPNMNPFVFAGIILAFMFIVQQIENGVLVPRIVGDALELHPLVTIIGVLMGGTLAGVLGAILAAPVLATLKLLGGYAARKMFDLPPFDDLDAEALSDGDEEVTR